ncbi:helix-turn-helix domain-containing protein [Azospirillum agricola]|uniref:helix-turn-helix domain-containing protein n=1 Tax=Azospirillum agricola TaxID=1720247 RepID=UPI000A0EEF90|nr:transcriptional regulator [Azospirillum agricola]SMH29504.1 DNA-binding transcriptional regulator YiaG, contains XRE-type HTH domain [Azospirillum lipoferum]
MTEGYHYTACGLDYVYLQDGYRVREGKHGPSLSITDATGLHEAIARAVIASPARLRGQEVRFLRSQLNLSQDGLARALRTRRGSVARWEAEPNKAIPGPADAALRMFYALKAEKHEVAEKIADLLGEIDELEHKIAVMEHAKFSKDGSGEWTKEAA